MSNYPAYTIETAPADAQPTLAQLNRTFGFLPNIAGVMATSPALIKTFLALFTGVHAGTFSEADIQILLLTNAVTNGSEWPVAFHSALATAQGVDPADVDAIRNGQFPRTARFAALAGLSQALIEKRGKLSRQDEADFLAAGLGRDQLLEAISVVAASTITNYVSSVAKPPLEPAFVDYLWQAKN
jgi:alkylhydroperoxidase family enzyme